MFPELTTQRLLLREINAEDAEGIYSYLSKEEVMKYYGREPLKHLNEAKEITEIYSKNFEENRGIRWGIEEQDSKGIIGTVGFHNMRELHKRAEIGYEIHPDYWRKGYASEAIREALSFGFQELDLNRIGAIVFKENKASSNLLMKLGFEEEGVLKEYMYQNGKPHDTYVYSILKNSR